MAQALRPAVAQAVSAPQDGAVSHLAQWPVQIKLVPVEAPWFNGARLLIAADCTAYARADFHQPVSYTHLDVYKRQHLRSSSWSRQAQALFSRESPYWIKCSSSGRPQSATACR